MTQAGAAARPFRPHTRRSGAEAAPSSPRRRRQSSKTTVSTFRLDSLRTRLRWRCGAGWARAALLGEGERHDLRSARVTSPPAPAPKERSFDCLRGGGQVRLHDLLHQHVDAGFREGRGDLIQAGLCAACIPGLVPMHDTDDRGGKFARRYVPAIPQQRRQPRQAAERLRVPTHGTPAPRLRITLSLTPAPKRSGATVKTHALEHVRQVVDAAQDFDTGGLAIAGAGRPSMPPPTKRHLISGASCQTSVITSPTRKRAASTFGSSAETANEGEARPRAERVLHGLRGTDHGTT